MYLFYLLKCHEIKKINRKLLIGQFSRICFFKCILLLMKILSVGHKVALLYAHSYIGYHKVNRLIYRQSDGIEFHIECSRNAIFNKQTKILDPSGSKVNSLWSNQNLTVKKPSFCVWSLRFPLLTFFFIIHSLSHNNDDDLSEEVTKTMKLVKISAPMITHKHLFC